MANTAVKPLCKTLPLPTTSFPSPSTTFTSKSLLKSCLSIRSRHIKLFPSLSLPLIHHHSRENKKSTFSSHVAQTSDWAQQDEQGDSSSLTALQDLEQDQQSEQEDFSWDDGELSNPEPSLSEWEASGEDAGVEAATDVVGDAGVQVEEGGFPEPPEEAKLFVGNLPYDVDSERLAQLFEPAGIVEIAEVIYNRDTDQSRGFGFVTMSTVEEADKAVEMFNRYDLNGRFLTVNKAAPRGTRPERPPRTFEPSFRIYVGNLPWDVDNARLEEVFSQYGSVTSARVVVDRETGRSRGFGFVTMSSETEVNDAIAALDGQTVHGRTVRVNVAEERPRRNF